MFNLRSLYVLVIVSALPSVMLAADSPAPVQPAVCTGCTTEKQSAALEKLLVQYKELANKGGWAEWKSDAKMAKKLKPQQSDARIATLRQILTVMGDYKAPATAIKDANIYDDTVIDALKHFQSRHGLNMDGKLNMATQKALAVPVEKRITQIMATRERMREHPLALEPKSILVNLPAFTLYGYEDGKEALTMRVIVGSARNHTPLFDNQVTDVIFNPQWHVPERIARNEMIPKLRKNPSYFVNANFVVTQDGVPVDPMKADLDSGGFSFRQRAGTGNALGKIKFNIPDSDNIYLHSTSSPKLFANDDRALSHGCIRLQEPRELAHFVMRSVKDWDAESIDEAYDAKAEHWVKVDAIPVHLVYWTAAVEADGTAHFYGDIYGKDKEMQSAKNEEPGTIVVAQK